ncbi:UPF0104 family protein [Synechococcus sp. RSCCF101]|uniref:lysylphosphatidylglycerol synthase domain-containing protein n=1 Tax=Synechococcus sp. RSCCF101 TaxID=2511069 RepID=UPI0012484E52|nr:lysylphosphatidylglycerol synthase domain-containing protein [Synechococcus sp. RSCCF101]QEY32052.1 UPF0104 family protein [Synechococcus sp. RSCCF101]
MSRGSLLKFAVALACIGFVAAAVIDQGQQLLALRISRQGWLWLAVGLGITTTSMVCNAGVWAVLLRWLGRWPKGLEPFTLYLTTNVLKYLPGNVWHLAARVKALKPVFGLAPALVSVLLEPILMATAALALVPLGGLQGGLGLIALLPLLALMPRWLNPLLARLERSRAEAMHLEGELAAEPAWSVPGYPLLPLLAALAFVLIRFLGFACCVVAFSEQAAAGWPVWIAGFALAWTAGLVVPGAPGGLGVFEAALLLRFGSLIPEAPLLAIALCYRLLATLADGLLAATGHLDRRLVGPPAAAAAPAVSLSEGSSSS